MSRVWGERVSAAAFVILAIYLGNLAWGFPHGGGIFPLFSVIGIIFLSILLIVKTVLKPMPDGDESIDFSISFEKIKAFLVLLLVGVYLVLIFELGYYTSTVVFLVASTVMVGVKNYKAIALTAIILIPLMYAFFELFLQANLPRGILI
ncbi:MAG: tripartite tricarboxylate transporter TctB family protein [Rhodospirillales bacterium]|nr:tripartite tricarboxylate transporter TctB family protein [Rhodospirillales bacterium]